MDYISITKYWRYQIKFNLSETFEEYYFKLIKKNKQLFIQMFELPDELWNHIKEYQLDWKKKHKKKLFKVVWEMEYLAAWHGCSSNEQWAMSNDDGHWFSEFYFDKDYGGWAVPRKKRREFVYNEIKNNKGQPYKLPYP